MLRRRPGGLPYPRVRLGAPPPSTSPALVQAPSLFQLPYRPPEIEVEYARTNHQLYFQVVRRAAPQNPLFGYLRGTASAGETESGYARANHQLFFQVARQPVAQPALALTLFRISYRLPDVELDYQRFNHSLLFQFIPAAVVVSMCWSADSGTVTADSGIYTADSGACPIAPPTVGGGGLLPGRPPCPPEKLGTGMGPYKRPGQVFGEPDPLSPRLSSRAEVAAEYVPRTPLTQQLPLIEFPAPVTPTEQDDTDTVVFALVALDELCGSPTDLLRGPITLKIVRRKV